MSDAAGRPLRSLLEEIASATPAPGGGSSAGWTCAIAAALVEMAAGFGTGERMAAIAARAHALRELACGLAERELHAYEPVLDALKLPKTDPDRPARLDAALSEAAETPLGIVRACAEVVALAVQAAEIGSPHLRGDALAGRSIAAGACEAAARLVEINLAGRPGDPRLAEAASLSSAALSPR